MTSTRERVLNTLLARPRSTINDLAESVGINPISVRHHIARLEAEGLVTSDEELHGVGRPRRVYFLTEDGVEHFPTRYMRLTLRLLEQMKESMPEQTVKELFATMAEGLVDDYTGEGQIDGLNMEERLELLQKTLHQEGFNVEWEKHEDAYHIREITCPYLHISQYHPEVCAVDQALISAFLDIPAEKVSCLLHGDAHCTYVVNEAQQMHQKKGEKPGKENLKEKSVSVESQLETANVENNR
jgi:DeoR family suf operon transcriptional repressor